MITCLFGAAALLAAPVVIENVRVEVGDGTVLERATVLFDGGRIREVGTPRIPAGAERIDGAGKVLAPGFIETLTQIGLVEVGLEAATNDTQLRAPITPAFRAADGYNPLSARIPVNREEGVTSAITSPTGVLVYGTGYWVDLTGTVASAPDASRPAAMFGGIGGSEADEHTGARGGLWLALREIFDDVRFFVKNRPAFDRGELRELSIGRLHLEAMIPVVEGRLPLVLYVHRASDILAALSFAREQKVRLIIAGGLEAWTVAEELAAARVPVIVKPSEQVPGSFDALAARDDAATLLTEAGVQVVLSAVEWDQNIRRLRQEAGTAVAYGMPHAEALRAITSRPAALFGKGAELGTVSAGKRANLVLWSGDPLELSSIAERVWIDGVAMPQGNRQRELVKRYLPVAR